MFPWDFHVAAAQPSETLLAPEHCLLKLHNKKKHKEAWDVGNNFFLLTTEEVCFADPDPLPALTWEKLA